MSVIRDLRAKKNISQSKLAKILNVHQTAVSQWEKNRTFPDTETLKKIADYFGVSVDYLVGHTSTRIDFSLENKSNDSFTYEISKESEDLTDEEKDRILAFVRFTKSQRANDKSDAYIAAFGGNINVPDDSIDTPPEVREAMDRLDNEDLMENENKD